LATLCFGKLNLQRSPVSTDFDNKAYAVADGVSWTETGGDLVLFESKNGAYVGLNPTSSAIWRALIQGCSADEIVEKLVEQFNAETEILNQDVAQFLDQMVSRGLVLEII
tara:strand:- start:11677 stop:12006 length:330 start_codon:yes stop_codon:yes gene_type:complete